MNAATLAFWSQVFAGCIPAFARASGNAVDGVHWCTAFADAAVAEYEKRCETVPRKIEPIDRPRPIGELRTDEATLTIGTGPLPTITEKLVEARSALGPWNDEGKTIAECIRLMRGKFPDGRRSQMVEDSDGKARPVKHIIDARDELAEVMQRIGAIIGADRLGTTEQDRYTREDIFKRLVELVEVDKAHTTSMRNAATVREGSDAIKRHRFMQLLNLELEDGHPPKWEAIVEAVERMVKKLVELGAYMAARPAQTSALLMVLERDFASSRSAINVVNERAHAELVALTARLAKLEEGA